MEPCNAVVKNGRLTLDEPTDLPEGRVVVLIPLEALLDEMGAAGEIEEERGVAFQVVSAPRQWREPRRIGAKALLDELRALE